MATLSASTWGDPSADKHALLLHGLTLSSLSWYRIAQALASRGYFVTAPDLLGHGNARRSSDYTITAFAEELRPFFTTAGGNDHPYHIVIGHSLGGLVASALLPLLKSSHPVRVVLIDAPLELAPEIRAIYRNLILEGLRNPKTPEAILQEHPSWAKEDAIYRSLSVRLCEPPTVEAVFDQNEPNWSFSHYLSTSPDNVKVTALAADPSKLPCVTEEDLKPYPHVTFKVVWGTSHFIQMEAPQAVVDAALE